MDRKNTIMTDSSISKDDEEIRVALYANIGFLFKSHKCWSLILESSFVLLNL